MEEFTILMKPMNERVEKKQVLISSEGEIGPQPASSRDPFNLDCIVVEKQPTILIVDDDPIIRRLTCRMIKSFGYNAITAESGEEALKACTSGQAPQLIVTDMCMPKMSGDELVAALRLSAVTSQVILMSGAFTNENCDSDGNFYMAKPYTRDELHSVILKALGEVPQLASA